MTIFAIPTGAASDLVRSPKLRPHDLTAKQLAWCRRHIPGFRVHERAAKRVRAAAERNRQNMENNNAS